MSGEGSAYRFLISLVSMAVISGVTSAFTPLDRVSVLIPFLFVVLFYLSRLPHFRVHQTAVSPSGKQPECSRCIRVTELSFPVFHVVRKTYHFEVNIYGHSAAKSCGKFAARLATSPPLLIKYFAYLSSSSESSSGEVAGVKFTAKPTASKKKLQRTC